MGVEAAELGEACFKVVQSHRSIRSFKPDPIPREHLDAILEAARRHASPWNLQPVHVTVVTDRGLKERLAEVLWGQRQIAEAPVFLVFSVDYAKILRALERQGAKTRRPGLADYIQGVISASIALSWAALVAEGLGYAINFIAVYGRPCETAEVLKLPELVVPVAGLNIGKPADMPGLTPRAPREALVGVNGYGDVDSKAEAYKLTMEGFIEKVAKVLGPGGPVEEMDERVRECLRRRGFNL
ncbi:MAG: nitroreductase family protein [Desulfurococcales archaeon]|nr:nitroreductase family protein [Desulfurococcales archaeon]